MNIMDYFKEISCIPRGSKNEQAISNYIVEFAKKHNLKYIQDEMFNVVVYKDATSSYEDHEPVMLQGHIDMVCEKNEDVIFDFEKDALKLYEEDGYLKAKGTTLGADDGYAVAYMLSMLENGKNHPALECVFTVQEEIGLVGVKELKKEYFKATRLIGMDSGGEEVVSVSSSGGRRNKAVKKLSKTHVNLNTYTFMILGCLGGHSGGFINKERANAIKLAFRFMKEIAKEGEVYITDIKGGLKENAIPRECKIEFCSDLSVKYIDSIVKDFYLEIKEVYEVSDPDIQYELRQIARKMGPKEVYDDASTKAIIDYINLVPCGVRHISMSIPGLTIASDNIGVIRIIDDECVITSSIRSPLMINRNEISNEMDILGKVFGFEVSNFNDYPGWNYDASSEMRKIYAKVVEEKLGKQLVERAGHGGLEAGVLKGLIPELDIVTLGPKCSGAHTPQEMMDIESFFKMYDILEYFVSLL